MQHHPHRILALALALPIAAAACSSSGSSSSSSTHASTSTTTAPAPLQVTTSACRGVSSGRALALGPSTRAALAAIGTRYLQQAVAEPVHTGKLGAGFGADFEPAAAARVGAGGADAAAMTEMAGPLTGSGAPVSATLACTVLGDATGKPATASLAITATAASKGRSAHRTGELLVVRGGDGHWRIGGYDITVVRDAGDGTGATTTSAGKQP